MEELRGILRKYWGYDEFRPLQQRAMECVLSNRDSVVVLSTGGGKSLCFQAPAMQMSGLAVVLSPLISLMQDQVNTLLDCGISAAFTNSTQSSAERRAVADEIRAGRLKLLYLSPERLMAERTIEFLQKANVSFIAIDEAHCISDWGHDFRPEYRMLRKLKEAFPGVGVHAYTATATEHVRHDIARELHLSEPEILVGSFDRPNLLYRVLRRANRLDQVKSVLERHRDDAGIIYCIRRVDVDELCAAICAAGYSALPYHAGLSDQERQRNQEAFIKDRARIIVATVAFGMGIDKPDVRFVIHAGAPKALENYQQESGRAGRDGLEAECILLYSGQDFQTWRSMQRDLAPAAAQNATRVLAGIERFCASVVCRRNALLEYFGELYPQENCFACDVCLAELELVADPLILAQKILSCVMRLEQNYGGDYTAMVLIGAGEQRIADKGHDKLSTFGLLKEFTKRNIRDWIDQLGSQGLLEKSGEYGVLKVTPAGWKVLRGELTPKLVKPSEKAKSRSSATASASWEGVEKKLFEELRGWRKRLAEERSVPPFVIFNDATLRELARRRPSQVDKLLSVPGIGDKKLLDYGYELIQMINEYCQTENVEQDVAVGKGKRVR